MPRPKNNRIVYQPPIFTKFKPMGVKGRDLDTVCLSLDEFEAIRLADSLGMFHEEASEKMQISRSTFSRLIDKARGKVSEMLINGKKLVVEGGNVHFRKNVMKCKSCAHLFEATLDKIIKECPSCKSQELVNLAGGFGHGNCCVK